ncbi:MAG TPA: lycopene cyclase domain-containing protein, partial [Jatrophihabitans sp.]|nr:lycopene cyclase domain-containing protein [Jatrophihabitans sp.]
LLVALLPGVVLGIGWDLYAIHRHQWSFDRRYLVGVSVAGLPLEEALFFVVVPLCAVLTLEAVRRRRPGWTIGDEGDSERASQARQRRGAQRARSRAEGDEGDSERASQARQRRGAQRARSRAEGIEGDRDRADKAAKRAGEQP